MPVENKYVGLGYDPNAAPPKAPDIAGGATSAFETPEQEQNIKDKASQGHVIGMDDLSYMGHFATDKVTRQGHNVGHKKLGIAHPAARTGAKQGYHKLPGSASGMQGKNRDGEITNTQLGLRSKSQQKEDASLKRKMKMSQPSPTRPMLFVDEQPKGVVPRAHAISDVQMSVKHHRESIANDKKHAKEHMASVKKHTKEMQAQQRRLRSK